MKTQEQIKNFVVNLDDRQRKLLFAGVLLLVFLGDYFLLMYPFQIRTLLALGPKNTVLSKDIKQAKIDSQRITQYQNEVALLRSKQMVMGNRIVAKEAMPLILDNISRLANNANVRINQIMPYKEGQELALSNDDGKYYSLPILVEARAGYHQLARFMNSVENDNIFMSITGFSITANTEDAVHHTAKITIKAFILEKKSN